MPLRPLTLFAVLAVVVALAALLVPLTLPAPTAPGPDGFERRVRAYLMTHPEVIFDAVTALKRRDEAQQAANQQAAVRAHRALLVDPGPLPVAGNPAGDVTVVEFFDYRCPYCRQAVPQVRALLAADKGVRLVLKEFPVLGPDSVLAARAAIAAAAQGRYFELHDALMAMSGELNEAAVMAAARGVGLDLARLKADMVSPPVSRLIDDTLALGHRLFISGTPTFIIGETIIPGYASAADLAAAVAAARRRP